MSSTAGKVVRCKAAVCWAPGQPLVIEEIEVDPPKSNEIRLRMVSTSLCHSDLHALNGMLVPGLYHRQYPVVLGHEGAGVVESVGPGVTEFQPGDHAIPLFGYFCKNCQLCLSGKTNMCMSATKTKCEGLMMDGTTRMRVRGQTLFTFVNNSTFSEYTVLELPGVAKVNPKADLRTVGVMGCCIPTGMGAALNTAGVTPGSVCAVWGLGAVGLAIVLGCKLAGAKTIVGVDISPSKEELGMKMGCTHFVNPKNLDVPIAKYFEKEFKGGCDFTFESIGNVSCMKDAFGSTRPGWGICTIVGVADAASHIEINALAIVTGRNLRGCLFGDYKFKEDLPRLVEEVVAGKYKCEDFITETMKLEDINRAIEIMKAGKGIRSVIHF